MGQRLELQGILSDIVGDGSRVYFQPPPTEMMKYPAIVYRREMIHSSYADNLPYQNRKRYQVTVISEDPDCDIVDKVALLPLCSHERFFTASNLNHDVFNIFF